MSITAAQVNALRQKTGVSMMACKKALVEANGDEEQAIEMLRKRGEAKAVDKADRATSEGVVAAAAANGKGAIVKIACETDFVARNEEFIAMAEKIAQIALEKDLETAKAEGEAMVKEGVGKLGENMTLESIEVAEGPVIDFYVHSNGKLGALVALDGSDNEKAKDVAMHVVASDPKVINPEEISDDLVAKEKEIWTEQLKAEGKPENIIDNILAGKEKKFREEAALMKQAFVKNPEMTIESFLDGSKVTAFMRIAI